MLGISARHRTNSGRLLPRPEFTRKFWVETWQESEWKPGASWKIMIPDGRVADSGEIIEIDPPRRMVLRWRNEFVPEFKAEGDSQLSYELEKQGEAVKLTLIHEMEKPGSKMIEGVLNGWPMSSDSSRVM